MLPLVYQVSPGTDWLTAHCDGSESGMAESPSAERTAAAALSISCVSCVSLDGLTSQQLGLAVDELWLPCRAVALTSVMENLDEGALLSCRTGDPLVERVLEHQVELRTILEEKARDGVRHEGVETGEWGADGERDKTNFVGVDAVDLPQLLHRPL